MTLAIESGFGSELADLGQHKRTEIVAWLQERRDLTIQQEDRLETVGWVLLMFVVVKALPWRPASSQARCQGGMQTVFTAGSDKEDDQWMG